MTHAERQSAFLARHPGYHARYWARYNDAAHRKERRVYAAGHRKERRAYDTLRNAEGYGCWRNMIQRCFNPNNHKFYLYGARGVTVCEQWRGRGGFKNFITDMGPRPSPKHSIDRWPDKTGNYEPENCRWATDVEQQNNRRPRKLKVVRG